MKLNCVTKGQISKYRHAVDLRPSNFGCFIYMLLGTKSSLREYIFSLTEKSVSSNLSLVTAFMYNH